MLHRLLLYRLLLYRLLLYRLLLYRLWLLLPSCLRCLNTRRGSRLLLILNRATHRSNWSWKT